MNIRKRIDLLVQLGIYLQQDTEEWQEIKERAFRANGWFTVDYINQSVQNICEAFLKESLLQTWVNHYQIPNENFSPKKIGLVMAGNIPLVGFHDLLCCFITGHLTWVKTSSKDEILIKFIVAKMTEWEPETAEHIVFAEQLRNCEAYIATGSNNTARYFEFYFAKYPHVIRKNRTSVAVLDATETVEELDALADDVMLYFGLGCRNVTQLYVPKGYDFIPLLAALKKYNWASDHNKYRNNYDYNLALHMLNSTYYMTNETTLMIEHPSPFSPISQLNFQFYEQPEPVLEQLQNNPEIQAIVGHFGIAFGKVQQPTLTDYADGVDTMEWLKAL